MIKIPMQQIAVRAIENLHDIESYLSNDPVLKGIWPDYNQILEEFPEHKKELLELLSNTGYDTNTIILKIRKFESLEDIKKAYIAIFKPLQDFAYVNTGNKEYESELEVFSEIGSYVFSRYASFMQKFGKVFYQ